MGGGAMQAAFAAIMPRHIAGLNVLLKQARLAKIKVKARQMPRSGMRRPTGRPRCRKYWKKNVFPLST
jgi:hypothetical protein